MLLTVMHSRSCDEQNARTDYKQSTQNVKHGSTDAAGAWESAAALVNDVHRKYIIIIDRHSIPAGSCR